MPEGYTGTALAHQRIVERGAPFLQKPFTSADLLRTLRRALAPGPFPPAAPPS